MTIHIGATIDEIADTVLLPGDPMRAKWAAEQFLTSPRLVNQVRGMFGYTGTFNGNRVTIQGSGMGMPSLSIYANELISDYNAQTLILSLIHISEPTRQAEISYAVFCLKKNSWCFNNMLSFFLKQGVLINFRYAS